jgi:hypothetical protein
MSWKSRQLGGSRIVRLTDSTLTLTSTPTTPYACAPFGHTVALLQTGKLTEWVSTGEVWRPLGVTIMATTTITTTAPVYTLKKGANSTTTAPTMAAASSGGVATGTLQVAPNTNYYPFTTYLSSAGASLFTADAAGDVWGVTVSTSPAAGAANISLNYVLIDVAGISDAVTTL